MAAERRIYSKTRDACREGFSLRLFSRLLIRAERSEGRMPRRLAYLFALVAALKILYGLRSPRWSGRLGLLLVQKLRCMHER